jgi:hypothetical protein
MAFYLFRQAPACRRNAICSACSSKATSAEHHTGGHESAKPQGEAPQVDVPICTCTFHVQNYCVYFNDLQCCKFTGWNLYFKLALSRLEFTSIVTIKKLIEIMCTCDVKCIPFCSHDCAVHLQFYSHRVGSFTFLSLAVFFFFFSLITSCIYLFSLPSHIPLPSLCCPLLVFIILLLSSTLK